MALSTIGAEGVTTAITTVNATIPAGAGEASGCLAGVSNGNTQLQADTSVFSTGSKSFKHVYTAAGVNYVRTTPGLASNNGACDFALQHTGLTNNRPASGDEFYLLQARASATTNLYSLTHLSTGFIRIRTSGSNNLWTSTAVYDPSTFKRVSMAVRLDLTTPANSQVRVAVFAIGSDTPITGLDSGWITAAPTTTGAQLDGFFAGHCTASVDTTSFNTDTIRWDPAATDLLTAVGQALSVTTAVTVVSGLQVTSTITPVGYTNAAKVYDWDWGDGTTTPAQSSDTKTHTYSAGGTYTVTGAADYA